MNWLSKSETLNNHLINMMQQIKRVLSNMLNITHQPRVIEAFVGKSISMFRSLVVFEYIYIEKNK